MEANRGTKYWLAVALGIAVTLGAFWTFQGWYRESANIAELVARVIVVASVIVAAGSVLQVAAHHDDGDRFWELLGKCLVASGAVLTALVSVLGALTPFLS